MDVKDSKSLCTENDRRSPTKEKQSGGGWIKVLLLSLLVILEGAALATLTLWQEKALGVAEHRIEVADRLLLQLEEECQLQHDENLSHEGSVNRDRRQTISELFHELLAVQNQVLSTVCDQHPDLCTKGPKGIHGDSGDLGVPGAVGAKGDPGARGPPGDKGQVGPTGDTGPAGHTGPNGLPGSAGPQGTKGVHGDAGAKGDSGDRGAAGATGPVGPAGLKGEPGSAGPKGQQGGPGDLGAKGVPGDPGPIGPAGVPGPAGPQGKQFEGDCMCVDVPTVTGNFTDIMSVHLHHPLTLHCDVSDPKATVTWQRTDGKTATNHVEFRGNDIIFTSIRKADEGVYDCVADTLLGKVQKAVDIRLFAASPYDCDFEDDFCSWTNTKDDNFDWLRHSGTTPTAATGPSVDHTLGTQPGQYAYIETSSPRANHDAARLQSAVLNPQQEYCLSFWYHMYGANLGDINVRISSNGITGAPVQTLTGPSEDKWKQDFYTIHPQSTPFRIVIEGVSGPGYQGDAAIDDIAVTENACP